MAKNTVPARRAMNLLVQLSGQEGHGEYKSFPRLWSAKPKASLSVYEAATCSVGTLPEGVSKFAATEHFRSVALECERIAADPALLEKAIADYPNSLAQHHKRISGSGHSR